MNRSRCVLFTLFIALAGTACAPAEDEEAGVSEEALRQETCFAASLPGIVTWCTGGGKATVVLPGPIGNVSMHPYKIQGRRADGTNAFSFKVSLAPRDDGLVDVVYTGATGRYVLHPRGKIDSTLSAEERTALETFFADYRRAFPLVIGVSSRP